jgi:hypothetical protein
MSVRNISSFLSQTYPSFIQLQPISYTFQPASAILRAFINLQQKREVQGLTFLNIRALKGQILQTIVLKIKIRLLCLAPQHQQKIRTDRYMKF